MDDMVAGGSPSVLRGLNSRMVLRTVRDRGPMSKAQLTRATGLSRPTINEVVSALAERNLIVRTDQDDLEKANRSGRPGRLLRFDATTGALLGVDIGADKALVMLTNLDGEILVTSRVDSRLGRESESLLETIRATISQVLEKGKTSFDAVKQAVVSTPGHVDPNSGSLNLAPQLPSLTGQQIATSLGLTCPVVVENEMHVAVIGERWQGAAQGEQDIVYVGIGVGVGAGIMLQGRIHRGAHGAAGEIGYLPINGEIGQPIDQPGSFESLVGARAFGERGRAVARTPEGSRICILAGSPNQVTAKHIFEAAEQRDSEAVRLVDGLARVLARGIATLIFTLDPALVIVGGGISKAGDTLLVPLREHLAPLTPACSFALVSSQLGDEAAAVGAIRLARDLNDERMYALLTPIVHAL